MQKFILIFLIFFSTTQFAQNKNKLTKERYNFLVDSLTTRKNNLLQKKNILLGQIDSLENVITELKTKVKSAKAKQLIKKYGKKIGQRLAAGKIWKGMTERMLKDSWGMPDRKTINKKKWGYFTQLYYGTITFYFKNHILTDLEEK